jgi:glutathione S-transferase
VLAWLKTRVEDFLGILDHQVSGHAFVAGETLSIADISMCAYLSFPADETGFDWPASHPGIAAWLTRLAAQPGWRAPYDLLPGQRLPRYA